MSDEFDLRDARRKVFMATLKPLEKLVALALLDHWSAAQPNPFPSIARLAKWTSAGRCTVMRAIAGLETAGAIVPIRRGGQRSSYDITPLMQLPVSERYQSSSETSLAAIPDQSRRETATGLAERPEVSKRSKQEKKASGGRARRWHRVPTDWAPKDDHVRIAKERGLNLAEQEALFRDHEWSQPKSDADAAFRNWLRKSYAGKPNARQQRPQHGANEAEADAWGKDKGQRLLGGVN